VLTISFVKVDVFPQAMRTETENVRKVAKQSTCIQGVSRLVDITAGGDFLGLCDQKVHINLCPILDGYGVMTA
jgi:hypothetical protein